MLSFIGAWYFDTRPNPVTGVALANMEGKEQRIGLMNSVLWGTSATAIDNGSVNSMHDSWMPLAGLMPLWNILIGEMLFGGIGCGMYCMLFHVLITVFIDIFRSRDMGGGAKALWVIFVIILPFLGVFVYLIARGGKMSERAAAEAADQQKQFDAYVRQAAGTEGADTASQLSKLADLKAQGVITDAEFQAQKAKVLAS